MQPSVLAFSPVCCFQHGMHPCTGCTVYPFFRAASSCSFHILQTHNSLCQGTGMRPVSSGIVYAVTLLWSFIGAHCDALVHSHHTLLNGAHSACSRQRGLAPQGQDAASHAGLCSAVRAGVSVRSAGHLQPARRPWPCTRARMSFAGQRLPAAEHTADRTAACRCLHPGCRASCMLMTFFLGMSRACVQPAGRRPWGLAFAYKCRMAVHASWLLSQDGPILSHVHVARWSRAAVLDLQLAVALVPSCVKMLLQARGLRIMTWKRRRTLEQCLPATSR